MIAFRVNDMTCGHCVATLTGAVRTVAPEAAVTADLARHVLQVEANRTQADRLMAAMRDAGYTTELMAEALASNDGTASALSPRVGAGAAARPSSGGCCGGRRGGCH